MANCTFPAVSSPAISEMQASMRWLPADTPADDQGGVADKALLDHDDLLELP